MLTKHQERAILLMRQCFSFMEEVPIKWDSKNKRISTNPETRKWIFWWTGNLFVFSLWLSCVYTLGTEPIFHRKSLGILPTCILSTGLCCFSAALFGAWGVTKLRNTFYVSAINEYIQFELKVYKKYYPYMLSPKRKMTWIDMFYFLGQLADLTPYLVYICCMCWNLDGPYFVLEDVAPDPEYRSISIIIALLLIRTVLLIPGFVETIRALEYCCIGYMSVILYIKEIVYVLCFKVTRPKIFFEHYSQLQLISNVFGKPFERTTFVGVTICYFLGVQIGWIFIRGFQHLDPTIYLFFVIFGAEILAGAVVFLPVVSSTAEVVNNVPIMKLQEMRRFYVNNKSLQKKGKCEKSHVTPANSLSIWKLFPVG